MKTTTFTLGSILLALGNWAAADTVRILTITSDATQGVSTVDVDVEPSSGKVAKVIVQTTEGVMKYPVEELHTPHVCNQVDGLDVVFFSLEHDFDAVKGGHANLRYLQNGITKSYRNFRFGIDVQGKDFVLRADPNPADPESDGNDDNSTFNSLFMKKKTLFRKTIGIDSVVQNK